MSEVPTDRPELKPEGSPTPEPSERWRWWVCVFKVPWLSLVLTALLAAVIFGPLTRWEPWVFHRAFSGTLGSWPGGFSPDGKQLITRDGGASVWEIESGRKLLTLPARNQDISWAAFSPDGRKIVTGHAQEHVPEGAGQVTFRLWDSGTGEHLVTLLHPVRYKLPSVLLTQRPSSCAHFLPNGAQVVTSVLVEKGTGPIHASTCVWDTRTGERLVCMRGYTWPQSISPDGARLLTVTEDHRVRVRGLKTGRELLLLEGHEKFVSSACFSPDGSRILTASHDGTVREWDARTGEQLRTFQGTLYYCAVYSPSGDLLVCNDAATARVRDARTGQMICELPLCQVAVSPDDTRLVATHVPHAVRLWDARTGDMLQELDVRGQALMSDLFRHVAYTCYSRQGRYIAVVPRYRFPTMLFKNRRPEWWWGIFCLTEFWLASALGAACVWSLIRDVRRLRRRA